MLEFMLISFMASEFVFDLLPAVSYGTGMEWRWNGNVVRGWKWKWMWWVGMESKSVGMGVISVPMQVSNTDACHMLHVGGTIQRFNHSEYLQMSHCFKC